MRRTAAGTKWCVAGLLLLAALWVAGPASANEEDYVGRNPPSVGNADTGGGGAIAVEQVSGQTPSGGSSHHNSSAGGLALTGSDIAGLLLLAAAFVGTGAILSRRGRSSVR